MDGAIRTAEAEFRASGVRIAALHGVAVGYHKALVATLLAAERHQRDKDVGRRATYERASVTPVWKILLRPPGAGETLGDAVTLWVFPIVRSPLERITEEHGA